MVPFSLEKKYPFGALFILNRVSNLKGSLIRFMTLKRLGQSQTHGLRRRECNSHFASSSSSRHAPSLSAGWHHGTSSSKLLLMNFIFHCDAIQMYYELAWSLLCQRRYLEAAEAFANVTKLNFWCVAIKCAAIVFWPWACCYSGAMQHIPFSSLAAFLRQEKFRECKSYLTRFQLHSSRRGSGNYLLRFTSRRNVGPHCQSAFLLDPKILLVAFYKEKQGSRGGDSKNWIDAVKINPAEGQSWPRLLIFGILTISSLEIGICERNDIYRLDIHWTMIHLVWNIHSRVKAPVAQARIDDLTALSPPVSINELPLYPPRDSQADLASDSSSSTRPAGPDSMDLDNPDELAVRALLLGINYRTLAAYEIARGFLVEASKYQVSTNTWVAGIAMFEMAVLDLKETEARTRETIGDERKRAWKKTFKGTSNKLDCALSLSGSVVDLSSRLEGRVSMLRDEIAAKAVMEGITL